MSTVVCRRESMCKNIFGDSMGTFHYNIAANIRDQLVPRKTMLPPLLAVFFMFIRNIEVSVIMHRAFLALR